MLPVSIVIPVHNRAHTLQSCVDSILNQTHTNFELIIVDDHSVDNSLELAESYAAKDTRIHVIKQDDNKHGAQAARNTGIKAAKFDWLMFNDSDDIWHTDKIKKELTILEKYNYDEHVVIYSDCNTVDIHNGKKEYWALPHISAEHSYKDLLVQSAPMFQSLVCSKKHLDEIGFLDESCPSYQEWDTSIRLAKNGKFLHIKEPLFDYFVGADDAISKSVEKDFIGRCNIYNKFKDDIVQFHGKKKYKILLSRNVMNACHKLDLKDLMEQSEILKNHQKILTKLFGNDYLKNMESFLQPSVLRKIGRKVKIAVKKILKTA